MFERCGLITRHTHTNSISFLQGASSSIHAHLCCVFAATCAICNSVCVCWFLVVLHFVICVTRIVRQRDLHPWLMVSVRLFGDSDHQSAGRGPSSCIPVLFSLWKIPKVHACCRRCYRSVQISMHSISIGCHGMHGMAVFSSFPMVPMAPWLLSCWAILCKRSNCRKPSWEDWPHWPPVIQGFAKPGWLPAAYIALKIRYPSPIITLNPLANHHFPIQIGNWNPGWPHFPLALWTRWLWWPRAMQFSGTLPFWYVDICR